MSLLFYTPVEASIKQIFRSPWAYPEQKNKKLIIHCCYHKVGTAWFIRVLRSVARYYGLKFQHDNQDNFKRNTEVFLEHMSRIDTEKLPDYIGSHMIRDPRDMIISAYFYHLWTKEEWAHIPRKSLDGLTYQQHLNSFDREEGLLAEMRGTSKEVIEEMAAWDYNNPCFIEIKYEEILHNEVEVFAKIFKHYGFSEQAIQNCLQIAEQYSFSNKSNRKKGTIKKNSHLRSGRTQEWKEVFTDKHKRQFKELFGDVLIKLGYETNNDW